MRALGSAVVRVAADDDFGWMTRRCAQKVTLVTLPQSQSSCTCRQVQIRFTSRRQVRNPTWRGAGGGFWMCRPDWTTCLRSRTYRYNNCTTNKTTELFDKFFDYVFAGVLSLYRNDFPERGAGAQESESET